MPVLFFFLFSINLFSQKPTPPQKRTINEKNETADTTSEKYINIRYADELNFLINEKNDTIQKLIGNVELNQDSIFIFCDSSTILNGTQMIARGNFILQQGDSTTIFADSSEYSSNTKIADLYSNVSMLKGQQKLFTERLTYNANEKIATYLTGATLTDDTTFLKSTRGYFHAKTDDIFFKDSVVVVNPDFTLRSDTLKFNARSKRVTFLAPTLISQDTAKIYTESGFYDINKKYAEFRKNPQYVKNNQKAWAIWMTYDGNEKEVVLLGDAHFEDSTSVATADVIRHNERTGVTILEGNGFYQDEERTIVGDTIEYNSKEKTYSTRGRSKIVDGNQILEANNVNYIKEREVGIATGNVIFTDTTENMTVICEYAEHSKKRNFLKAFGGRDSLGNPGRPLMIKEVGGDSLYISADTLVSYVPQGDSLQLAGSRQQAAGDSLQTGVQVIDTLQLATGIPDSIANKLKTIASAADSLATTESDSIVSDKITKPKDTIPPNILNELDKETEKVTEILKDTTPDSNVVDMVSLDTTLLDQLGFPDTVEMVAVGEPTNDTGEKKEKKEERIILAYHDVRIFKNDLQALCDSMSYNSLDSLFRLYDNPIIWSDTSQFTANHTRIQLANDAIDKIFMEENSFIINSPDEVFFNQIKGRNATAFFDSSQLRTVRVVGNAESVYYALDDDDAYIGVNKTVCSEMKIIFGNNEVEGIVFYSQPKANLFPMKEADHSGLQMEGFNWQIHRRPNSVEDLVKLNKQSSTVSPPAQKIKDETFEKVEELIPPEEKKENDRN